MKKLQNCLYITKQESYLHKERETLVIKVGSEKLLQIPIHSLQHLFCFGNVLVSPFVLGFCGERGVGLSYFTEYGKYLGRLQGIQSGNILLRKSQYRASDGAPELLAQTFIASKIHNSRSVLKRFLRNHGDNSEVDAAVTKLNRSLVATKNEQDLVKLRGIEGEAASTYFSVFNDLITEKNSQFAFTNRTRRPPRDAVNAMLSFAYSLIGNEISSAMQGVGLDPQAGFLHADRPGRDSLAQDMLEEFRAWWADRFVLSLINRKQISFDGFEFQASGAVIMKDDTRKSFLTAWQSKKQEEITHPYLNEKMPVGLLPHIQSLLLARYIRGDLDRYPAFVYR